MDSQEKQSLIAFAHAVIKEHLGLVAPNMRPALNVQSVPPGLFVTVYHKKELRGSMGNVMLHDPLPGVIAQLTLEAAFHDPKLRPLKPEDYPDLRVEISMLSALKRIFFIEDIQPDRHGVYIHKGRHAGLLLPQVWKDLPNRTDFLNALCHQKAGLPFGCWRDPEVELYVFTVETIAEATRV